MDGIVITDICIVSIIAMYLIFEYAKFRKNPEGYWKTMIELQKLKRREGKK